MEYKNGKEPKKKKSGYTTNKRVRFVNISSCFSYTGHVYSMWSWVQVNRFVMDNLILYVDLVEKFVKVITVSLAKT